MARTAAAPLPAFGHHVAAFAQRLGDGPTNQRLVVYDEYLERL